MWVKSCILLNISQDPSVHLHIFVEQCVVLMFYVFKYWLHDVIIIF